MTKQQEAAYQALFTQTQTGRDLMAQGKLPEAEAVFAAILALIDQELPNEPLTRATALHNLAAVRAELGDLTGAEAIAREALAARAGPDAIGARISTQALLATILVDAERWPEALPLMDSVVRAQLENPDLPRQLLAADMAMLAVIYAMTGDFAAAEDILGQFAPILPEMPAQSAIPVYAALGRVNSLQGQPDRAEAAYRKVLALSAGLQFGEGWRGQDQANALGNLASILQKQGRNAEAVPLFEQALALLEQAGLANSLRAANLLDGLGNALNGQKDPGSAWQYQRLALDLRLHSLPADDPQLAGSFATLGETLLRAGQAEIAAQSLGRALSIAEARHDEFRAGRAGLSLAAAEFALGQPGFDRANSALRQLAKVLPPDHPELTRAGFSAAWLALGENRAAEALPLARLALASFTKQAGRIGADATIAAAGEPDMRRQILAVTAAAYDLDPSGLMDEAFQAAQWALATRVARATQRMTARFAAGDDALAGIVRAKQDLVNQWSARDADYVEALAKGRDSAAILAELAQLEAAISQSDADLTARFPKYDALIAARTLPLAQAQAALTQGEVLLLLVPTPDETYVFAISPDAAIWHRAAMGASGLTAAVTTLRRQLDPSAPTRSAAALEAPSAPAGPAYDRQAAFDLYSALLAPLDPVLQGANRVLVVADGPLSSLPLSVLVASAPMGSDSDPQALAETDWLGRRYAFATLPAVQSLATLGAAPQQSLTTGFAGFGAPNFGGASQPLALSRFFDSDAAQAAALRNLAPLPATKRELLGLARVLGADETALHLGDAATETAVKSADLATQSVIAFATHGLIAGDITGLAEPALAFSPPAAPDDFDDGLLTASEAAKLRLSADWVILSACNTAAADGTPGAEGLSGLASAFLYAGARGLLVSHWPVRDDAAAALTQGAVTRLAADPGTGQAQALRLSMQDLMQDPAMAHPSTWGPFVVVGNGR